MNILGIKLTPMNIVLILIALYLLYEVGKKYNWIEANKGGSEETE